MMKLNKSVAVLRQLLEMTPTEFGEACNVSARYIRLIEGGYKIPSKILLSKMVALGQRKGLNVSMEYKKEVRNLHVL